ncbi:hypothetical protein [Corynebacterium alimapuense]|uniref:Uncharacterized protein n=1 Tax=Corynebacterium alimapuense TaxID=1576874 RepID=A0A3M8KB52_9CORY|nr:hypothetical protein [Corynebacterium alimapuense]RNE49688.1 hypothetical protein C5L39_04975 [Corynebacterium alimapuense]
MSIDRVIDQYYEQQGTVPQAPVVPDNACQVFEKPVVIDTPDKSNSVLGHEEINAERELAKARRAVDTLLRS